MGCGSLCSMRSLSSGGGELISLHTGVHACTCTCPHACIAVCTRTCTPMLAYPHAPTHAYILIQCITQISRCTHNAHLCIRTPTSRHMHRPHTRHLHVHVFIHTYTVHTSAHMHHPCIYMSHAHTLLHTPTRACAHMAHMEHTHLHMCMPHTHAHSCTGASLTLLGCREYFCRLLQAAPPRSQAGFRLVPLPARLRRARSDGSPAHLLRAVSPRAPACHGLGAAALCPIHPCDSPRPSKRVA